MWRVRGVLRSQELQSRRPSRACRFHQTLTTLSCWLYPYRIAWKSSRWLRSTITSTSKPTIAEIWGHVIRKSKLKGLIMPCLCLGVVRRLRRWRCARGQSGVALEVATKTKVWCTDSATDVTSGTGRRSRRCVSTSTSAFSISSIIGAKDGQTPDQGLIMTGKFDGKKGRRVDRESASSLVLRIGWILQPTRTLSSKRVQHETDGATWLPTPGPRSWQPTTSTIVILSELHWA